MNVTLSEHSPSVTDTQPAQQAKNVLYAQAGGVTAVINVSAAAVIETIQQHPEKFGKTYAAINGIKGVLEEELVDLTDISTATLAKLKYQPGAAFKACRFDLDPLEHNPEQYRRVLEVFKTYEIGYFLYNGGNGSMVTAQKVADYCCRHGHPVTCVGVAKTIDNDLALSHCSPGFGSAAKYLATSFLNATLDIIAMHETSTKFFVLEAMGRNTGWLTLATGLIKDVIPDAPIIILPAERPFNEQAFFDKVDHFIATQGYCVCAVSEGLVKENGDYISIANIEHTHERDYVQLGGVGATLAHLVGKHLNSKTHYAIPDYCQRSASHMVSQTDWQMAYDAGKEAVNAAFRGEHGVLPIIELTSTEPFEYRFKTVELNAVADLENTVPDHFLTEDGMDITQAALDYLRPLIQGEHGAPFKKGLPDIAPIAFTLVDKQLPAFKALK
ncbi:pyrophosphate--fructose 6-phosphate 1-phosphotransferase [Thiomicrorhabdus immobilis]|uniref:Pyrophosphate--fructose 6-phosphate 1-phosphotransferase n=1 Tax=Thiomicrorhabdus immobilis TaxID=2791037 RepID=A0ABN6CX65_9GAMM|nr:6-phosphofructokinase [Thiomicrorhabdus immobilis]BCN93691.1 pyrophosphate--fructose 6-phosphate 1-phosphotransferase [Thiomicrorhabdus immobilis]